ncbi:hypothetical protein F889_03618 [Acinetobacter colistiniresistens]|uniref:Glycosyltransferase 2-like domain-containing protein n=1 Tax=Acinetobacter colistiniresistens TaxID=280145 RepID=N9PFC1_9GAMM|nr:glycosyltransferase family A protein [Acinetobacter colistiniresistens]ENX32299.1 hypothetical protein F889_03618 [Acinetobacter colistiniresistens]
MKPKITIFTPSYNRAGTLNRLYESLKSQDIDLNLFEWLIVNDGSQDNTDIVVKNIIDENIISIKYFKQENKGKQSAWNFAVDYCDTDLFCCVDSDDRLHDEKVLSLIIEKYYDILMNNESLVGIRGLTVSSKTLEPSGKEISKEEVRQSYFDEISNNNIIGERIDVLKTEVIKKYIYPVRDEIKFIPELWFYVNIAKDGYQFLYVPERIGFFYDETEINRLTRSSIKTHANGHYISRSSALKYTPIYTWMRNPDFWFRTLIRFSQTAKYIGKTFGTRCQDTNIIYALFSYPLSLLTVGFK